MEIKNFPNLGFIVDDVPRNIFEDLTKQVSFIKENKNLSLHQNTYLDNNFNNVYKLEIKDILVHYLLSLANTYVDNFESFEDLTIFDSPDIQINLDELWVNFQQEGEFNPNHKHTGLFSFAIYLDIPYQIDKSKPLQKGSFEFTYTNTLGNITNYVLPTDQSYQGKIIFFPSKMLHCVYPFYNNNETRITISGNLKPKLEKR
jgi:hypothetical protein